MKCGHVEAQVALFDVARVQPGIPHQFIDDAFALGGGQRIALVERGRVLAHGEAFDFLEERAQVLLLQVLRDLLVVPGIGRVSGQFQLVHQVVRPGPDGLQVEGRGDQDHAIERDAAVDQVAGQSGGAEGAVALPGDEQGREGAVVAGHVHADEFAHRLQVAGDAVHAARDLHRLGAAVAGAHRIQEDQVGLVQPGVGVVLHLVGRRRHGAIGHELGTARAHRAHMHPDGGRARPAVEAECQGPLCGVRAIQRVGHVEDVRFGFARGVLERHLRHGGGVVDGLAVQLDGVFGDDRRLIHVAADGGSGAGHASAPASAGRGLRGCLGRGLRAALRPGAGHEREECDGECCEASGEDHEVDDTPNRGVDTIRLRAGLRRSPDGRFDFSDAGCHGCCRQLLVVPSRPRRT